MTSLEDSILKKNIPGKYTTWKEDQNDKLTELEGKKLGPLTCIKGGDGDGDGDNEDDNDKNDDRHLLDGDDDDSSDDAEFMEKYRRQRMKEIQEEHAQKQQQQQQQRGRRQNPQDQGYQNVNQPMPSTSAGPVHVIVDAVPEIDGIDYVNMVNEQQQQSNDSANDTTLIVLLYHDIHNPVTSKLLSILAKICIRSHTIWSKKQNMLSSSSTTSMTAFPMICCRLNSNNNNTAINIDPIVLPAILIHQKDGTLTHNLTPVIEHLIPPERGGSSSRSSSNANNFAQRDVYELLESCGVPLFYNLHDYDDNDDEDD